jgi:hypothetical protein
MRPQFREIVLPDARDFSIDVIDTWNMTIERVGRGRGTIKVPLGGRQYMAIRAVATD